MNNEKTSMENIDALMRLASLCVETRKTISELTNSFKQMEDFHKKKLGEGDVNYSDGKSRVAAIDNLKNIVNSMQAANLSVQEILAQVQSQMPTMVKGPSITLGAGSSVREDEEDEDSK